MTKMLSSCSCCSARELALAAQLQQHAIYFNALLSRGSKRIRLTHNRIKIHHTKPNQVNYLSVYRLASICYPSFCRYRFFCRV
jgi:hypothetical protein